ncbi:rhomboid family intramembrane serine protease [Pedobacter chitinilyticus]|uniref:Rhomboid family intramembrane serine protease n=1 Tax=Pedobacter chitinilyticus TaxID=2233776 RepID=A0A443YPL0_9SPHI|nr:rhomboid family intramembrane serine protease [Pedobacter chitinilyticus]RWU05720.1 rhomboid family intramembrane serine protease [Pedobacter chitinilyticus]
MNNINIPPVVKNLLIINGIFFLATLIFEQQGKELSDYLGAHYFDSPKFQVWQPITYMFMHGDFMHLFFNMFGLFMFGGILEQKWGPKRFINFYLITGLGALALQWLVQGIEIYQITGSFLNKDAAFLEMLTKGQYDTTVYSANQAATLYSNYSFPMVGASGAVFGIMTAFAVLYPNVELMLMFIPFPVKAKYFIPIYIVIELFLGVARIPGDSIAHFAHLGGALIGFILVKLWKDKDRFYDYYE